MIYSFSATPSAVYPTGVSAELAVRSARSAMVADVSASLEPAQLQADDGCDLMVFSYDRPLHLLALLDTVPTLSPPFPVHAHSG